MSCAGRERLIPAVDTTVLRDVLDVLGADETQRPRIERRRASLQAEGGRVAWEVVSAEVAAAFHAPEVGFEAMERLGVVSAMSPTAAGLAGSALRRYRAGGGARRGAIADFLVGAHASVQAERLLTRDGGFHRAAFGELVLVDPSSSGR